MKLFNLFGTKPSENVEMIPEVNNEQKDVNNTTNVPADSEEQEEDKKNVITITWGTGMPIDVIFNFIHKNYEEDGFQDALINSDITYRDAKENIIRNDLEMLFKRIVLCYKKKIREIDVQIDNAQKALALSAASGMEAIRVTYEEHLEEISEMQKRLNENDPKMMTMIESYRRGFLKGVTATSNNYFNVK